MTKGHGHGGVLTPNHFPTMRESQYQHFQVDFQFES